MDFIYFLVGLTGALLHIFMFLIGFIGAFLFFSIIMTIGEGEWFQCPIGLAMVIISISFFSLGTETKSQIKYEHVGEIPIASEYNAGSAGHHSSSTIIFELKDGSLFETSLRSVSREYGDTLKLSKYESIYYGDKLKGTFWCMWTNDDVGKIKYKLTVPEVDQSR